MTQPTKSTLKPPTRLLAIDVLRAIAVILVIVRHAYGNIQLPFPFQQLRFFGWTGVDLFFVLSGFLVSGLLFKEMQKHGKVRAGNFLLRRGGKIYPAFFFLLLIEGAMVVYGGGSYSIQEILTESFFLQNYFTGMGILQTWSLAVEEHFYLLLAATFALIPFLKRKRLSFRFEYFFLAVALACLGLRMWNASQNTFSVKTHLFPTHLRIDSLLCGVLLAYLNQFRPRLIAGAMKKRKTLFVTGLALVSPLFFLKGEHLFVHTVGFTLLYCGYALILLAVLSMETQFQGKLSFIARPLAYIGKHSYSIYLWHLFFLMRVIPIADRRLSLNLPENSIFPIYLLGSIAFGILMANLIELPFLKLRDRVFAERSRRILSPHPSSDPSTI